jgi:hypothetical protein
MISNQGWDFGEKKMHERIADLVIALELECFQEYSNNVILTCFETTTHVDG